VNGKVYINGKQAPAPEKEQTSFYVITDGNSLNPQLLKDLNIEIMQQSDIDKYVMVIPTAHLSAFKSIQSVKSIIPIIEPAGNYDASVFPHNERFKWNQDNYGPLKIPRKGMTIALNDSTLALYRRAVELYEKNKLEIWDGKVWINGQQTNSYTFKMNYYWMMGDNRHRSHDSRFWGYVPEDHIVGKAKITWLSIDSAENLLSKIRWDRFMKPIK
jgi:signal peptidase I